MNQAGLNIEHSNRPALIKKGRYLEYFTIGYNSLEGVIAIGAGLIAGSIALVGFGFDSLIEVTSGSILLWRLYADVDEARRERIEAISLRLVGLCFVVLALYVTYDSVKSLIRSEAPEESIVGILLAAVSLVVMPLLVRAKRRVARGINSGALMAVREVQTESRSLESSFLKMPRNGVIRAVQFEFRTDHQLSNDHAQKTAKTSRRSSQKAVTRWLR